MWKEGKSPETLTPWAGSERNLSPNFREVICHQPKKRKFFSAKTTTAFAGVAPFRARRMSHRHTLLKSRPDNAVHSHRARNASQYWVREAQPCSWPSFTPSLECRYFHLCIAETVETASSYYSSLPPPMPFEWCYILTEIIFIFLSFHPHPIFNRGDQRLSSFHEWGS